MSDTIFQNSGCVNTILGSLNQLNGFLPLSYVERVDTTLNTKYRVLADVSPLSVPKLLYFGIGSNGYSCTTSTANSPMHIKHQPDCRNMDLYNPIPIRVIPLEEEVELPWSERSQYRMRVVKNGYAYYYLKLIDWDPGRVEIIKYSSDGEEKDYALNPSNFLNPSAPTTPTTGGSLITSDRIIVRATGICRVSMTELEEAMSLLDQSYCMISEFGFYTGCDRYINGAGEVLLTDSDVELEGELPGGAEGIEATYVQLAKHKTQLPVTLDSANSTLETTVSFEASNSIII